MFFTYTPDDGEPQDWEFVASEVKASAAEVVEKSYGSPWDQFLVDVFKGGMRARRHLLWHLMCREHPTLLYIDAPDFKVGEIVVEFDKNELQEMRDQLVKAGGVDDAVLAHIDAEIAKAPEGSDAGKARLNRSERRTASRSRGSSTSPRKTSRR